MEQAGIKLEDVKVRLGMLGFYKEPAEGETDTSIDMILGFLIRKVSGYILVSCNIKEIPAGFYEQAVDMVCAGYLQEQKNSGQLTGFDYAAAVKAIQEGDTNVTFSDASRTSEQRLEILLAYLDRGKDEWVNYRRLKW